MHGDDDIEDDAEDDAGVAPITCRAPPATREDRDDAVGRMPDWNSARDVAGRLHRRAAVTSCASRRRGHMIPSLLPGSQTLVCAPPGFYLGSGLACANDE